jgi:signal transduction histidine kinase
VSNSAASEYLPDTTASERALLLGLHNRALDAIGSPVPVEKALACLAELVEEHSGHRVVAAIMLVNLAGSHLRLCGGPSLPQSYRDVMGRVAVREGVGTCPRSAAWSTEVITPDIATADSWKGIAHLPLSLGLKAAWSAPIRSSDGHVLGTFTTYFRESRAPTDWERKIVEGLCRAAALAIELRSSEQALREAERLRKEYLAVLGHELRGPLAPIVAGLELLTQARDRPELVVSTCEMMQRQVGHLVRLVEDLFDTSRIATGKIRLERAHVDLRVAIDAAVEQVRHLVDERDHELVVRHAKGSLRIYGDVQRLTQVVSNLLNNAVKYTPSGGSIFLCTETAGDQVLVRIRDAGLGIPPARINDLFKMYSQLAEDRTQIDVTGLGIGLALSRSLIALHGGSIEAKSRGLGHGSEFIVRLPLGAVPRSPRSPPARAGECAGIQTIPAPDQ